MLSNYSFRGKYASYVSFLTKDWRMENSNDSFRIFSRYIDIYMISAIFGIIYNKTAKYDPEDNQDEYKDFPNAEIRGEMFVKESLKINSVYKVMILISPKLELSENERVDKAFRGTEDDKEMQKLLESYVLGGLIHIHNLFKDVRTAEEASKKMFDIVDQFNNDKKTIPNYQNR